MIESISSFIIKLFEDFSLKRLAAALLGLILLAAAVLIYERYTSNFELNRIQKTSEILAVLQDVKNEKNSSNGAEMQAIKSKLLQDLGRLVNQKAPTSGISEVLRDTFVSDKFKEFLAGAAPWFFLLLLSLPSSLKRPNKNNPSLVTFATFTLISGGLATVINLKLSAFATGIVFFIVPLILVCLIGVVAAITIPQFAAYRIKSYHAVAISTLRNAVTNIEAFFADHAVYPKTLQEAGVDSIQQQVKLEFTLLNPDHYFLSATHEKGTKMFFVFSDTKEIFSKDKESNPTEADTSRHEVPDEEATT